MRTTITHHCQQCLSIIRGTTFSASFRQTLLNKKPHRIQTAPAVSSSSQFQQVREAFLRAGPGRDLGRTIKNPTTTTISSASQPIQPDLSSTHDSVISNQEEDTTLTSSPPLSPSKKPSTAVYKEIVLLETDFRERFIKGGGNGGQKINKTNSNVELKHFETGIVVQCQATRSLPQNRKLARRILIDRLDEYYNGDQSKRGKKAEKIRQRKMRMARKSAKKYHGAGAGNSTADLDEDEEDEEDDDDEDFIESEHGIVTNNHNKDESEESGGGSGSTRTRLESKVPETTIQLTTLEEVLASDNKKPSRRKSGRM
ncbi:hypothetical protein BGZ49_001782 [Haplosporangium sp. Z 27]|nr:hypothetical protein BGZ49_001782 [Haplosporangium sp. Z 27]